MRPDIVWHVARKELVSTLRDRRALISSLLIPLLILPTIMIGLPLLLGGLFDREQSTVTEIGVQGLANIPQSLLELLESGNVTLIEADNLQARVEAGEFTTALQVPATFMEDLERGSAETTLYIKEGSIRSTLNADKIDDALDTFSQDIVAERLAAAGLDEAVLNPIEVTTVDASSEAERSSGQLAWLIPFFIAMWTLSGGQVVALDATAGEKERGTLEALLVAPVRRAEVVTGKFLATLCFGLAASFMAILGYIIGGAVLRALFASNLSEDSGDLVAFMGGSLSVTPLGTVLLIVTSLLLAGLVAALLISITMFARTAKEAQTYVAPLAFVMIIPAVGLQFAEFFTDNVWLYAVPILNALVLMDAIVKDNLNLLPLLVTWGSLIAFTVLLLDIAFRNFRREGVIFRT